IRQQSRVNALRDREVPISRLLIVPILFSVWGIYGVTTTIPLTAFTSSLFVASLLSGGLVCFWINRFFINQPKYNPQTMIVTLPGQPLSLLLILSTFSVHFVLSVFLALEPNIVNSAPFVFIFCALSGFFSGSFWGQVIGTLKVAFNVIKRGV
ncbi:DUF6622 family protein, partial [Vibrio sp. ER1A]|uniref:DUF6622 family protein n=1 Tax=Vibrio sp. ER1A TaxID=1517681 RepID=UPI001F170412